MSRDLTDPSGSFRSVLGQPVQAVVQLHQDHHRCWAHVAFLGFGLTQQDIHLLWFGWIKCLNSALPTEVSYNHDALERELALTNYHLGSEKIIDTKGWRKTEDFITTLGIKELFGLTIWNNTKRAHSKKCTKSDSPWH